MASAAFAALLVLSVFWPSPVVSINQLCCSARLDVDDLSFLGREAPSWDVAFWCLTGLLLIAILQSAEWQWRDFGEVARIVRTMRVRVPIGASATAGVVAGAVALIWRFADSGVIAWAESMQSDAVEDVVRIVNRFGGGMNAAMLVGFFLVAGVVYRARCWVAYAVAMAIAGLSAGLLAQILKTLVGRTRPELWLGPFHQARAAGFSFPSGHTVGAFALAGVLLFASRNWPLRVIAPLLAIAVAVSRVLAFRHWLSDVTASAGIGLITAWVVTEAVMKITRKQETI